MKYICINEFYLPAIDEDGFTVESDYRAVPVGSVWYPSDENMIGGEIHLECESGCDDFGWIEITQAYLMENFELSEIKGGADKCNG